jgi:hypothetical protein
MLKKLFGGLLGGGSQANPAPSLEQRRKMARRPCSIEVEAVSGRSGFMVTVVDMGPGGLRLHNPSPVNLKKGAALKVVYPEPIPKHEVLTIDGVVRWTRLRESDSSQMIGVEYKDQKALGRSWVKAKMQAVGFSSYNLREQRTQQRADCGIRATLDLGAGNILCGVANLGLGGFFVLLRQPIRAGATISVKIAGGDLAGSTLTGVVRHQQHADPGDPFGYGCAFGDLPVSQEEALRAFLLKQHEQNWERLEEWPDLTYAAPLGGPNDDVEIPDLASILAEDEDDPSGDGDESGGDDGPSGAGGESGGS